MSNGHYSVMVTATGSGYSRWNDLAVTRWQADPTEDRCGTFIFLRDVDDRRLVVGDRRAEAGAGRDVARRISPTTRRPSSRRSARCAPRSSASSSRKAMAKAAASPSSMTATTDRHIEVTSFAELVLAPEASDNAHPAFSKMFVETEIAPSGNVIFAQRGASAPQASRTSPLAHFVTDAVRRRARRRGRDRPPRLHRPRPHDRRCRGLRSATRRLGGSHGFTLDPIMSLRRRVRVPRQQEGHR